MLLIYVVASISTLLIKMFEKSIWRVLNTVLYMHLCIYGITLESHFIALVVIAYLLMYLQNDAFSQLLWFTNNISFNHAGITPSTIKGLSAFQLACQNLRSCPSSNSILSNKLSNPSSAHIINCVFCSCIYHPLVESTISTIRHRSTCTRYMHISWCQCV